MYPSFFIEQSLLSQFSFIAGLDEVGRGCLFGPVYAGIVVIDNDSPYIHGIRDSKLVSQKKRNELAIQIKQTYIYGIGSASHDEIDTLGIMQATRLAMLRAYWSLPVMPGILLIDGEKTTLSLLHKSYKFVKGDQRLFSIAAASIIAKEARDVYLKSLAEKFPEYDLENNMGYATKNHREALGKYGATPLHRKTFISSFIS